MMLIVVGFEWYSFQRRYLFFVTKCEIFFVTVTEVDLTCTVHFVN